MLSNFAFTFQPDEDQEEFDHFTDEEEFEVFCIFIGHVT